MVARVVVGVGSMASWNSGQVSNDMMVSSEVTIAPFFLSLSLGRDVHSFSLLPQFLPPCFMDPGLRTLDSLTSSQFLLSSFLFRVVVHFPFLPPPKI